MDIILDHVIGSKLWTINFYREQLRHFAKVGLGNRTQHDVKVTPELIDVTRKRLRELTIVYDSNITTAGHRDRKRRADRKILNGQNHTNGNGTTASSGMQNNGDTRHARDKT